jgi:hypothetical protein
MSFDYCLAPGVPAGVVAFPLDNLRTPGPM